MLREDPTITDRPTRQRIFFLGIGGTLMGSLALLAKAKGFDVAGSDRALYPPMSDQLAQAGIEYTEGFDPAQFEPRPDLVVIGNAQLPRGHEAIEYVLDHDLPYTSGAEWLGTNILRDRWVVAVSGTHGKTTTASMIAHILEQAGLNPGFLIGGVPLDFGQSSRLGESPFFVAEADEYDTSYFDRRSKFVHYRPKTLVITNLEYDHADIFDDIGEIQTQFHHLIRTIPKSGLVIAPTNDGNVDEMLRQGCWTPVARFGSPASLNRQASPGADNGDRWRSANEAGDGSAFDVQLGATPIGRVSWWHLGTHNIHNALAAIAAARHVGVPPKQAVEALSTFQGVKRRMELVVSRDKVRVYDDFAHHPTAIRETLQALRNHVGNERILAVVEPRTHTMSLGTLREDLAKCCSAADEVIWFRGDNITWDLTDVVRSGVVPSSIEDDVDRLVDQIAAIDEPCSVVIMSNGGFGGIFEKIRNRLQ